MECVREVGATNEDAQQDESRAVPRGIVPADYVPWSGVPTRTHFPNADEEGLEEEGEGGNDGETQD